MSALKDVLNLPGALSASRIPLAAVFAIVAHDPKLATAVLIAAAASDIADGNLARRRHQTSRAGSALDAVADKVFVLTVAITLMARGTLTPIEVLLLGVRDLSEIVLFLRLAFSGERHPPEDANAFGKLTTAFQFFAVLAALLVPAQREIWILATAACGSIAAVSYWIRENRTRRAVRSAK